MPRSEILKPLLLGANKNHSSNIVLKDNIGENISDKNCMYCELTGHYWAWKNDMDSDYIGFFHYRRYFNFSDTSYPEDGWGNVLYDSLNEKVLNELNIHDDKIFDIVTKYDCILPKIRTFPKEEKNVYSQYVTAKDHHKEDFDLTIQILLDKYPDYKDVVNRFLESNQSYDCNMFILKRKLFEQYAAFVFDILFDVEAKRDFSKYNQSELRVLGYLAERLTSIWFMYNIKQQDLRVLELQKTLFKSTESTFSPKIDRDSVIAVISSSNEYVPYLSAMLESIKQCSKKSRPYNIFVLTTDISSENQKKLKTQVESDSRFSFTCININSIFPKNLFVNNHLSVQSYFRFYILDLFKNCNKVLYLDSDIIVNSDIADLFDENVNNYCIAAAIDVDIAGQIKLYPEQKDYIQKIVGIKESSNYFQAGVLLFNVKEMRKYHDSSSLIQIALNYNWRYLDQDILNHEFMDKVVFFDGNWNVLINCPATPYSRMEIIQNAPYSIYQNYLASRKEPKIIHYAGWKKPWNYTTCDFAEYFWKYARQTVFYEEILTRLSEYRAREIIEAQNINPRIDNIGLRLSEIESWNLNPRIDNIGLRVSEIESWNLKNRVKISERNLKSRKYLLKWIIGEGRFGKFVRKIWRKLRRR